MRHKCKWGSHRRLVRPPLRADKVSIDVSLAEISHIASTSPSQFPTYLSTIITHNIHSQRSSKGPILELIYTLNFNLLYTFFFNCFNKLPLIMAEKRCIMEGRKTSPLNLHSRIPHQMLLYIQSLGEGEENKSRQGSVVLLFEK